MSGQFFSFGCGRHVLTGTYEEQHLAYAEVSRIRSRMEGSNSFRKIEREEREIHPGSEELSVGTRIWRRKMDVVWKKYERQLSKAV